MAEKKRLIDIIKAPLEDLTPAELDARHERFLEETEASHEKMKERLGQMRASLTDKERTVLDMRLNISEDVDPVTQQRVKEIEEKALKKLRVSRNQ